MTKKKNRLMIDHVRGVIVVERVGIVVQEFRYKSRKSAEMTADFYKKLGWIVKDRRNTVGASKSQLATREKMRATILQEVLRGWSINKLQRLAHRGMVEDGLMFDETGDDGWVVTDLGKDWLARYLRDNPEMVLPEKRVEVVSKREPDPAVIVPDEVGVNEIGRWVKEKRGKGTFVDVARMAGVSITTIRRIEDGETVNFEIRIIQSVCRWLGVKRLILDD